MNCNTEEPLRLSIWDSRIVVLVCNSDRATGRSPTVQQVELLQVAIPVVRGNQDYTFASQMAMRAVSDLGGVQ